MPLLIAYGINRFVHDVALLFFMLLYFKYKFLYANSVENALSDLSLHCLEHKYNPGVNVDAILIVKYIG